VEHLFDSILQTYNKLKELGFTYYRGKVTVIDMEEEVDQERVKTILARHGFGG